MIKIENLNFSYRKKHSLFNNLQLNVKPGNIYGLLGKNGAGKTTLLKIISGLLTPTSGKCEVLNSNPALRKPSMLQDLFIVPEAFYLPPIKITDYVRLNSVFYPNFDHEQFNNMLSEFQLNSEEKLDQLSYGQKKKVILSFAFASNVRLVLLDEPTNGMDIPSKSQFRKLLATAATEERVFIISTHQARDLANIIDPIIILDNGEIVFNYSNEEISSKLAFISVNDKNQEGVLYTEETLGGYRAVVKSQGEPTRVDVELLFNAITNNPKQITELFNNK